MPKTYFVGDRYMIRHSNEWDPTHIELPERLGRILDGLEQTALIEACETLPSRLATKEEILLVHTEALYDGLAATKTNSTEQNEAYSSRFEDIYVNQHSFDCALMAAGSAIRVTEAVVNDAKTQNTVSNAFAAIRPPGHHAGPDAHCGFCLFNNVALCAKRARQLGLERVLILDWDVHAGQGTQYCIEDDPGIFLVNILRYEAGTYWPWLPECGIHHKYRQTINVPLQETGYGDGEYAAVVQILVAGIVAEWKPELILVSSGFDSAFGDREGQMRITPAGFGHLTSCLVQHGIPTVVLLEGGYFIDMLPEASKFVIRNLADPASGPPRLPLGYPELTLRTSFVDTFLTVLKVAGDRFDVLANLVHHFERFGGRFSLDSSEYKGTRPDLLTFPTRNEYPVFEQLAYYQNELRNHLLPKYENPKPKPKLICSLNATKTGVILTTAESAAVAHITPSTAADLRGEESRFLEFFVCSPLSWIYDFEFSDFLDTLQKAVGEEQPKVELHHARSILQAFFGRTDN